MSVESASLADMRGFDQQRIGTLGAACARAAGLILE